MPSDSLARPGLAYLYAFDWLAVQLAAVAGPVTALVTQPFHGVELLRRLPDLSFLEPLPPEVVRAGLSLGITPVRTLAEGVELDALAWLEPRREDAHQLLALRRRLRPGGKLYLLAGGPLARFLAERQQSTVAAYWPVTEAQAELSQNGFQLQSAFALHGLVAVAWHYLGEWCDRLGRRHWRDRAHFAMRRAFVTGYRPPRPFALACLTLERVP
jgi:hypothetical protein